MLRWSEADLEARLCRALDIAVKTVNSFGATGYHDDESPAYSFGPDKPVAETAMLLYAASASGWRPEVGRRVDELARLLADHARSERVLVDVALHPGLAFKFAVPHVLLTSLGYTDEAFDQVLRSCIEARVANGHDRTSSADLERRWISSVWTGRAEAAGCQPDVRRSLLGHSIDIVGGLRDDAYAFTHAIFYATDFGYQTCRLPRPRATILGEAGSLLSRYLDAEDYDLSGELLLAWPLTGGAWGPTPAFCFRVLASFEDQVGLLPCGNIDLARLTQLQEGGERVRYTLGIAYHTAYVMGLLCAASLRPGRTPPSRIVGADFDEQNLRSFLTFVDEDQGHWQPEFSKLTTREQRVLTPFILDVALVQNSRKHNYEALRQLVVLACEHGLAGAPLCRQTADLLQRIGECSVALARRRDEAGSLPHQDSATAERVELDSWLAASAPPDRVPPLAGLRLPPRRGGDLAACWPALR